MVFPSGEKKNASTSSQPVNWQRGENGRRHQENSPTNTPTTKANQVLLHFKNVRQHVRDFMGFPFQAVSAPFGEAV
jgi:hypothetical protein